MKNKNKQKQNSSQYDERQIKRYKVDDYHTLI